MSCIACCKNDQDEKLVLIGGKGHKGSADILQSYANQIGDNDLVNKVSEKKIYIHSSCRIKLKNSNRKRSLSADASCK